MNFSLFLISIWYSQIHSNIATPIITFGWIDLWHSHFVCEWGAQHSPAQMHRNWTKMYINYMFHMCPIHLEASLKPFFILNAVFSFSSCAFWKFQTICSGSSRCSFWLRIAQNSSSLNKWKSIFWLSFDSEWFYSLFRKINTFPHSNSLRVPRSPEGVPDL